jgi:hypothetical protein
VEKAVTRALNKAGAKNVSAARIVLAQVAESLNDG